MFFSSELRSWQLYLTAAICGTFVICFISLRIYSKLVVLKSKTLDDYVMIFASLCFFTYGGIVIAEVQKGYGQHFWDLTLISITNRRELLLVANCLYGPIISIIKLSLLLLILQIFKTLRWLRLLVYCGMIFNILFYFSGMGVFIALCAPKAGQTYAETFRSARCAKTITFGVAQGVINVVSDFYLLVIPIPAVWSLQIPTRRKIGVIAIFMTGLLACIASCLSLWIRIMLQSTTEPTWDAISPLILALIEMAVGIMVGCMPAFAAVFRQKGGSPFNSLYQFLRSKFSTSSSKNSPTNGLLRENGSPDLGTPSHSMESHLEVGSMRASKA